MEKKYYFTLKILSLKAGMDQVTEKIILFLYAGPRDQTENVRFYVFIIYVDVQMQLLLIDSVKCF